jgi:hypothetical protein
MVHGEEQKLPEGIITNADKRRGVRHLRKRGLSSPPANWTAGSKLPRTAPSGRDQIDCGKRGTESPAIAERLMEETCEQESCKRVLKGGKANKASPGVGGITVLNLRDTYVYWGTS